MKAFLIAYVTVKDSEKMHTYTKAARESMQPYGGKVFTKGKQQNMAVISFPDLDSLESWYQSDIYQEINPLRKEAADIIITSYVI